MKYQVSIRMAELNDIPEIFDLVQELAEYENEPNAVIATLDDYKKLFKEGLYSGIVAKLDSKTIGMAIFYDTFSTWKGKMLYLEDFVVSKDYRNKGVGQLIFDAVLVKAKQRRCKLIKWQVLDWNTLALNFYTKNKAVIEKEWWNGKIVF